LLAILTNQKDDFCYAFFKQISLKINDAVHVLVRQLEEKSRDADFDSLSMKDQTKELPQTEPLITEALAPESQ